MNFYPAELTTPPLALIALFGRPDVHPLLRDFLRSHHKPPVNSLGVADPSQAARVFGVRKSSSAALPTCDFLKADWFTKHRQRRSAVAVVLLDWEWVVGDPSSWTRACEQLDWVRAATKARGVRMVVAVVQSTGPAAEIPEERAMTIRRRTDIDPKCLVCICRDEGDPSLKKLGRVVVEQAGIFYTEQVRRVVLKAAERQRIATTPVYAFHLRASFKAGVFSEFKQDWHFALQQYQEAYGRCQEAMDSYVNDSGSRLVQRHAEICAVAEQVHIKIMALLLHQKRIPEALQQVERHLGSFKDLRPGVQLPAAALAAHWAWVCRQYTVAAQLLGERVDPSSLPDRRAAQPAFFYQCAALTVALRRKAGEELDPSETVREGPELGPGRYVGQLAVPGGEMPGGARPATDAEYLRHLAKTEATAGLSQQAIELLSKAHEGYKRLTLPSASGELQRAVRTMYFLAGQMAREYMREGQPATARKLLDSAASMYRREGWMMPLAATLSMLREASVQLRLMREQLVYSLELAAMPDQPETVSSRAIVKEAITGLTERQQTPGGEAPALLDYAVVPGSGLTSVVQLVAGFCTQLTSDAEHRAEFGVAFYNSLPEGLAGARVEVTMLEGAKQHVIEGCWEAGADGSREQTISLQPRVWQRCWAAIQPPAGALIKATSLRLRLGASSLTWDLCAAGVETGGPEVFASTCSVVEQLTSCKGPFPRVGSLGGGVIRRQVQPGEYKMRIGAVAATPHVAVRSAKACLVGEHLPLRVVIGTTGAPLHAATLAFDVTSNCPDDSQTPEVLMDGNPPEGVTVFGTSAGLEDGDLVSGLLGLPPVSKSTPLSLWFKMPAKQVGMVNITVLVNSLAYSLPNGSYADVTAKNEMAKASASADVKIEAPFQLTHAISAPPDSHVLLPPLSNAVQAAQPSGFSCVPCNLPFVLAASLHSAARCQIRLKSVELIPQKESRMQLVASCGAMARSDNGSADSVLSKGNSYSAIFQLMPECRGPSGLGCIRIQWQREKALDVPSTEAAVEDADTGDPGGITEALGAVSLTSDPTADAPAASAPEIPSQSSPLVQTDLPLPVLVAEEAVIVARMEPPPQAVAGVPFLYAIELTNPTTVLQDIAVTVGDTSGFVFAGERQGTVSVLPGQVAWLKWTMVAYNAGLLTLPDVQLTSARYSTRMRVSSSCKVFVMPKAPQGQTDAVEKTGPITAS